MPPMCLMKLAQGMHFFFLSILLADFVQSHIYQLCLGYSGSEFSNRVQRN
ncbi:hypothetical protein PAHAL_8G079700 [Panicum hallii]|uniref:Uncharacterized protein n=1 Tax=Panicum hallii TaxID=206008 RepID=A0A2T8I852_9POAL|nr:hypothetical protein PAHAL_8G079700 [Panicum hallii]